MNESSNKFAYSLVTLLLQLIEAKGSVGALLKNGLTYSQISKLISEVVDAGFVVTDDHSLHLTQKGRERIKSPNQGERRPTDGGWISPSHQDRIKQIGIYDIFIPKRDRIDFDQS